MKKIAYLLFVGILMAMTVHAQERSAETPVISFQESSVDFGNITQGDKVQHVFKFENTGKTPLIISNVAATCGCTVPAWPKEPIAPGQGGEIKVSFNSAGKMGKQNSVVRIYSNASEPIEKVSLISNVLPKGTR
ncbi:hypothetical protein ADIS_3414 [Lunatimonas lonarensis]|uniref:DUF1573 domain-containing protein n=1 Tax=Lunatimonas lonarensis TaxID=1232681 RepID=R7ZQ80_9BACT|nr:DUF1573 domain-containing protein [Lunatimonas lonarensis]EON76286.1 hypothetical protein ADIS_3414 [Lunatimonas lonarensis]